MKKQTIEVSIPKQLELLCELLETTPAKVLQSFINDVSLEVNSSGSDEREQATSYFIRCGHGSHRYDYEQLETMFAGLNWLRYQQYEKQGTAFKKLQDKFLKEWFAEWKAKRKTQ
jgi:hypothetical protein